MSAQESVSAKARRGLPTAAWFAILIAVVVAVDFFVGQAREWVAFDIFTITLAAYGGVQFAQRTGLPLWHRRPSTRLSRNGVLAAALAVMAIDAYFSGWLTVKMNITPTATMAKLFGTPLHGAATVLRAGINEEILFRLFPAGLIMAAMGTLAAKAPRWAKPSGIILTGLVFGLLHPIAIGLICGVLMAYIYFEVGLVPAMVVHFVADVIPYVIMVPLMRK